MNMKKLADDGTVIPTSEEEQAEAKEAMKGIFNGTKEVVFSPEALADLKAMGLTEDEVMAMLAKELGVQN